MRCLCHYLEFICSGNFCKLCNKITVHCAVQWGGVKMVIKGVLLPGLRKALSDIGCLAHAGCLLICSESVHFLLIPSAPTPLPFSQQMLASVSRKEVSSWNCLPFIFPFFWFWCYVDLPPSQTCSLLVTFTAGGEWSNFLTLCLWCGGTPFIESLPAPGEGCALVATASLKLLLLNRAFIKYVASVL